MAAVSSSLYLISYVDETADNDKPGKLQVVSFASGDPSAGTISFSREYNYQFFEVISLSQDDKTFVAICQDLSEESDESYVIAGRVSDNGKDIDLGDTVRYVSTEYSVDPAISRLSDTEFVIVYYYSDTSSAVRIKFGRWQIII